jgi:hypothetical protein
MSAPMSRLDWRGAHRLRFVRVAAGVMASHQSFTLACDALEVAVFTSRLTCAVAWPRTEAATRFAALSHTLMNGFFFI